MAYLAKLAKRISNARTAACATLLALVACAQGESKDFLTPDPHQISPVPVALRIDPELSIVPANQPTQFTATGIASSGQNLPVTVIWSVVGGTITSAGLFTGDHSGQFVIRAYLSTNPSLQDSARAAVWEQPSDVVEVIVSPDSTLIEPGEALKLEALAKLVDGSLSQTEGMLWQANGGQVDGSGRFTANAVGDYVVSAQANNGVKGDSRILVRSRARTVTGFSVNPSAVTVASGQSQQFSATTSWSDGTSEPASFAIWSSTGGTISNGGLFTAGSTPGVFRVIGQEGNGSHADTALVTVQAPLVTALSLTPASVNLAPGATQRFQATATLSDGTVRSFAMSWSATGGTINLNGDYTAGNKAGSYRVIAALPGTSLADTATVTIGDPTATLTGIVLNPSSVSLAAGGSQHFSVAALWSDGSSTAPAITWSATGGSVAPTGLYAAGTAAGTYLVIARASNGVADTSLVVITPAVLTGVSVNPASATVLAGSTQQFAAAGTWSNGGTATPTVTWSAGGGTISSAGLYSADGSAGTYRVIATAQGGAPADTGLVTVTVLPPTLTGLLVSPGSASLFPGGSRQFSVSGTMSDGSTVVPPVSWSATGGTISSSGLYTAGQNVGNYRVIARSTSGSRADTSAVAIALAAPVLTSVVVSPATVSMQTAGTKQFSVSGTWSDGSTGTPSVVWIATGGTITNGGLYSAGTVAGTYRVIATQVAGTKADTADVTVSAAPVLTGISVSPATLSLAPGATQAFTATGTYSNGSTGSPSVTWSATGGTISSAGVYTAGSVAGTFRVIAVQQGGSLADTSAVTINSATSTLTSLVLTPASVAMFSGGQQQFSATGQYSNGTSAPLAVNWSATGGAISAAGLYAAGGTAGSFRVVATDPLSGKADTSTVSISLAPPPGQYQVLVERDWNSYPDKAGVGSQFYVEGGLHTQYPALPVSAFWDLVPDPIFGKVIRYNQDPALNLL
ncbi:MAG TPA: Ig-like domain-containing protein, partial [Gemmatimonadales bacterium]|nr:Ig-like domain-containing protein [Gemmatimonadales bacterium]